MKKEEKIQEILRQAYDYARSGKYADCIFIESKLRSEGFTLAERVLDDPSIRDELDSLCRVATSKEEVERIKRFDSWLDKSVSVVRPAIKEAAPEVLLFVHDSTLFVKGPTRSFKIRRKFGSNELEVAKSWVEKDNEWLQSYTYNQIPDSNFEEITGERAVELVMGFVRSGKARKS